MAAGSKNVSYRAMLAQPGVPRFLFTQIIGPLASQAWAVALVLLVLHRFNSASLAGICALIAQVGTLAMPFAGAFLSRLGHKRVIIADLLLSALTLSAVAALSLTDLLPTAALIALTLLSGLTTQVATMGLRTAVTKDMPDDLLDRANAATFSACAATRISGPLMAGTLSAAFNPETAVLAAAALYVVSIFVVLGHKSTDETAVTFADALRDSRAALLTIRKSPLIRHVTLFVTLAFLGWGAFYTAMPTMVERELRASDTLVGVAWAVSASIDIVCGFFFGRVDTRRHGLLMMSLFGVVAGGGLIVISLATIPALLIGAALIGICETPIDQIAVGARQRAMPREAIVHAMPALLAFDFGASALGAGLGGVISQISALLALQVGGILVIAASGLMLAFQHTYKSDNADTVERNTSPRSA